MVEFAVNTEMKIRELVSRLSNREEGQDMIEYALLAALIAIAAIAVIILVGPQLKNLFQDVINGLQRTS